MGEHLIAFAAFPLAPFDEEALHFLPVIAGYAFNRARAIASELVDLPSNGQVILAWQIRQVAGTIDILEIVPVGNEIDPRADLIHPAGGIGIDQVDRYVIAHIRCQTNERAEERRIAGADRRAEPGDAAYGAGNNEVFFNISIGIVGVMVPADHVRERVIAVGLRVQGVMPGKKFPVGKRDGYKIILGEHQGSP